MLDHLKSFLVGLIAFLLCGMTASAIGSGVALVASVDGFGGSAAILGWRVTHFALTLAAFWFIGRGIRRKWLERRARSDIE